MSESQSLQTAAEPVRRVFNRAAEFVVKILSGGEKSCVVRFPTDAEWIERAGKLKTVSRLLGRGKSRNETLNSRQLSADLFARIRKDTDGAPFDAVEAAQVIGRLETASIQAVTREGDSFRLRMRVPGAVVEHLVGMPRLADLDAYTDASTTITNERRAQEIRVNLEPAARLYDKYVQGTSGYAGEGPGSVPVVHKEVVCMEIVAQLHALEEELNEDADPEA